MDDACDFEAISESEHWLRIALTRQHDGQDHAEEHRKALERMKGDFFEGDRSSLLDAVIFCAQNQLVMPFWVSFAFVALVVNARGGQYQSWDEAFGRLHPRGAHLKKLRRDRALMGWVYAEVWRIQKDEPKTPIDETLFQRVGQRLGIGKTLCNEMYYRAKREYGLDFFFWETATTMTARMGEVEL